MATYQIQDLGTNERIRKFFGLRGVVAPEVDAVCSAVVQLQDLSAVQGRGRPVGVANQVQAAAPQALSVYLYNDPARTPPGDIWIERLKYSVSAAATGALVVEFGQGDPSVVATAGLNAQGSSRDVREFLSSASQILGRSYEQQGGAAGPNTVELLRIHTPNVPGFDVLEGRTVNVLLPTGWYIVARVTVGVAADEFATVWEWREFSRQSNPPTP